MTDMGIDTGLCRQQIADALGNVTFDLGDGLARTLSPSTSAPPVPSAFDAWPVLVVARPTTMCMAETDWLVIVALPAGDQPSLVAAGDALVNATCDALMFIAKVTNIRPARWILAEGGEIPCWQFELTM